VEAGLRPVITFAEGPSATVEVRRKLRYVTKALLDDRSLDSRDIICLLASHGTVCNVMKTVSIQNAYGIITNSLGSIGLSIEESIFSLLSTVRELAVEDMFIELGYHGGTVNTHQLVGFRNAIASQVGLREIPDEHSYSDERAHERLDVFWRLYSKQNIVRALHNALNSLPRRLDYNQAVSFLQYNRPSRFDGLFGGQDFLYVLNPPLVFVRLL
jgi:hypothetical protein